MDTLTPATERKILKEMGWEKRGRTTWTKRTRIIEWSPEQEAHVENYHNHYLNFMGPKFSKGPWLCHSTNSDKATYHPNIISVLAMVEGYQS